jgi:hypothetical protein
VRPLARLVNKTKAFICFSLVLVYSFLYGLIIHPLLSNIISDFSDAARHFIEFIGIIPIWVFSGYTVSYMGKHNQLQHYQDENRRRK